MRDVSLSARLAPLKSVKLPVRAPPGSFFKLMAASVSGRHCMQHCKVRLQSSENVLQAFCDSSRGMTQYLGGAYLRRNHLL